MSLVPGFEHDVFVSYASADDVAEPSVGIGWVATFLEGLDGALGRMGARGAKTWFDKRDHAATGRIPDNLREAVESSATLLVFLSQAYLQSEWCAQERAIFLRRNELSAGLKRVFLLRLDASDAPVEFQEVRGYDFFRRERATGAVRTLGRPVPDARNERDRPYYERLDDVARGLAARFEAPVSGGDGWHGERASPEGVAFAVTAGGRSSGGHEERTSEESTSEERASEPTYDSDETRALALRLADARQRAKALRAVGADTTAVEREALELRRQLRLGGQLRAGDQLSDRYLLLDCLGRGGFGTVWRALDVEQGGRVAIKVLHPDQARDVSRRERFFRGARIMADLQHEGIVRVLAPHCEDEGYFYFVMELVDGTNLHHAVVEGRIAGTKAIPLLLSVGQALAYAHARNVIHRDVKPANILVDGAGHAKLTDFDLVKADDTTGGTRTGALGTYLFAAPEQLRDAAQVDARADVYGLAMTALFCLHGADLPEDTLRAPQTVISGLDGSAALKQALTRGIEVKAEKRYPDMQSFCSALEAARRPGADDGYDGDGEETTASYLRKVLLPVVVVAASAFGVMVWLSRHRPSGIAASTNVGEADGAAATAEAAAGVAVAKPSSCPEGMIAIPGGSFFMGSDEGLPMEKPAHQVTLAPFCIDRYEVTVGDYKACSDIGRCKRAAATVEWEKISDKEHKALDPLCNIRDPVAREKHPINCVDWEMSEKYCREQKKRLPTEAEWEFAARGPDGRKYPWGDDDPAAGRLNACGKECVAWGRKNGIEEKAMYDVDDGFANTAPVGSFPRGASRYGVNDVVGNVWEWTADWFGDYGKEELRDPTGPATGEQRVIRGGAWNGSYASWVRPTFRYRDAPTVRHYGIGFRCAK